MEFEVEDVGNASHTIWLRDTETGSRVRQGEIRAIDGAYQVFAVDDPEHSIDGRSYGWVAEALTAFQIWRGLDATATRPIDLPGTLITPARDERTHVSTDW